MISRPARPNITGSASAKVRVACSGTVRAGGRRGRAREGTVVMRGGGRCCGVNLATAAERGNGGRKRSTTEISPTGPTREGIKLPARISAHSHVTPAFEAVRISGGFPDCVKCDSFVCGSKAEELMSDTGGARVDQDRKSTRLNSSHLGISYAVFCL